MVGLLLVVAALIGAPALFVATVGVLIAGCAWLLVYSYRVWRTDPRAARPTPPWHKEHVWQLTFKLTPKGNAGES